MELDGSLLEVNKSVQGLERGLSYVVEQVDQLEQNLGVQRTQPAPDHKQPAHRAPPGLPQSGEHDGP
eukprot:12898261-Prorocentrum_lima.AAC.1